MSQHADPAAAPASPASADGAEDKGPSKKELKKAAAAAEKAAKKAEREAAEKAAKDAKAAAVVAAAAKYKHLYGHMPMVQSTTVGTKAFVDIKDLGNDYVGKVVNVRARLHTSRKQGSKMTFVELRQSANTIQALCAASDDTPIEMVAWLGSVSCESVIDVEATVTAVDADKAIKACSQSLLELAVSKCHIVSEAPAVLPFQYADASRSAAEIAQGAADNKPVGQVNIDTRLNTRWLDVRSKASNAIFRLQSRVGQYFREIMLNKDFIEIHTPKMIGTASEGGANVFKLGYFGKDAFLAQSPQLYKQMALQGDLERVFEVGPVFRAENANTHRHMTEFIGLDMEMRINEHYYEVLDVAEETFKHIFDGLAKHKAELEAVCAQHPFEPLVYHMTPEKMKELGVGNIETGDKGTDEYGGLVRNAEVRMLRIPFPKGIALVNTKLEEKISEFEDIGTEHEKMLGRMVKERYGVDFYIMDHFPAAARPFYTMPCPEDPRFSNSYDMYIRGEEIVSGAQRIHDSEFLLKRAKECGVDITKIKDYIDSFRLGAWPHGGMGVGCERLLFLYLGLKNVRYVSLFPRDPARLAP